MRAEELARVEGGDARVRARRPGARSRRTARTKKAMKRSRFISSRRVSRLAFEMSCRNVL